jgi:hypothetical protein
MMRALLVFVAIFGLWFALRSGSPAHWHGMPAPKDPIQTNRRLPPAFRRGDETIVPLATYHIEAVVLSRERYRFDRAADLAPIDLALGWGPMCVASVINDLKISQGGRFYEYSWHGEPPLEPQSIVCHSANTHCLPADDTVRRDLLAVGRHDWVEMEGYLVEVRSDEGGSWRSSLTRDDSGGGACEVMWVTKVQSHHL